MTPTKHIAIALSFLAFATTAKADDLVSPHETLSETQHDVKVHFDNGTAVFTIQRTFVNVSDHPTRLDLAIDIPEGGVATELLVHDGKIWRRTELVDAEKARTLFDEGAAKPPARPRPSVLLEWATDSTLLMRHWRVEPGQSRRFQMTVEAPTEVLDGHLIATYPRAFVDEGPFANPTFQIQPTAPDGFIEMDGEQVEPGQRLKAEPWEDEDPVVIIEASTHFTEDLAARFGRVEVGDNTQAVRLEIDLPERLSEVPKDLRVAFVIDASHSVSQEGIDTQLAVAAGYLQHAPDAHFEIILTRRYAERLLGGFAPAPAFTDLIAKHRDLGRLVPGNGSSLEAGFETAAEALKTHKGARAIVATTDSRMRDAFDNTMVFKALRTTPRSTIVHIIDLHSGSDTLSRSNHHSMMPIAKRHGGMVWGSWGDDSELTEAMLELVRPIRLDDVEITTPMEIFLPDTLDEGTGQRLIEIETNSPRRIDIRWKKWSRTYQVTVHADPDLSRRTAGWVFSTGADFNFEDAQQKKLAAASLAVTPWTSMLGMDIGKPPEMAYEGALFGAGGFGIGGAHTTSCGGPIGIRIPRLPDFQVLFDPHVKACADAHSPTDGTVEIALETTIGEIVDITLESDDSDYRSCVVERIWGSKLPKVFKQVDHRTHRVTLR